MASENGKKAMTAPETDAVFLTLLTLYVDGEEFLRLVDDKQGIRSNGNEFIPCPFKALLPGQGENGSKACRLQIDNTDLAIYKTVKQAVNHKVTCDVAVVLSSSPDTYETGPFSFILRNINATVKALTGDLYDFYMTDRKVTALTYSPDDFPGMYF